MSERWVDNGCVVQHSSYYLLIPHGIVKNNTDYERELYGAEDRPSQSICQSYGREPLFIENEQK
jgi:hypothetical protein